MTKDMQQMPPLELSNYWTAISRRRWLVVLCLLTGWSIATVFAWMLPPKYRSETVILIEQQKVPEHYVESNVSVDLQQRLQSMSQQILSRTRLLALIDKFRLYGSGSAHLDPDVLVERMRKDIGIELIKTDGRRDELSAFKVSYSAPTAVLAKGITTELTSLFISENLENRQQLSQDTTTFLESQLSDARKSLAEQEEKLRQFRSRYLGELPEQMQGNLQILSGLQAQLQAATDALNQAEQQNLYLRSLYDQYQATRLPPAKPGTAPERMSPFALDQEIANLKAQLSELSGRYTGRYPDVLRLEQQIADLEARRTQLMQDRKTQTATDNSLPVKDAGAVVASTDSTPLIQVTGELSANQLEITNRKERIKRLEGEIERYQSRLNLTPALEQQYAAVTRDYDQSRTYYESLLGKKLQSEMATNLEKRSEGQQFRMIDPPNLPERPYSPNRLAFALGGLLLGLAVGVAIAVLFEILNPLICQEEELGNLGLSGFTISVPLLATDTEAKSQTKMRILEGVAAGIVAVLIPSATLLMYYKH